MYTLSKPTSRIVHDMLSDGSRERVWVALQDPCRLRSNPEVKEKKPWLLRGIRGGYAVPGGAMPSRLQQAKPGEVLLLRYS